MTKGTVKWFNSGKGYGFITPVDGGKDIFVHASKLAAGVEKLSENEAVEFEVRSSDKGPQAVNVRPA